MPFSSINRVGLHDTIEALSERIGPRPPCSEQEGRAAEYVAGRLEAAGFLIRIEPFRGPLNFSHAYLPIYAAFVAAAFTSSSFPLPAYLLSLAAMLAMALENNGVPVVGRITPHGDSRNVIGIKRPDGEVEQRVVLSCHLDSQKAGLVWHPAMVSSFRASFLLMLGAMVAIVAGTGWLAFGPVIPSFLQPLVWLSGGWLALSVALILHRELFMPYVAGAADNASGAAAVIAAAEACGTLQTTELWCVATGCEESGHGGMQALLREQGFNPRTTLFVNVDNVGSGRVAYTTSEGMMLRFNCGGRVTALARAAVESDPPLEAGGRAFHVMNNDSFALLRRGYDALSIMAFDERGLMPHWHWPTDVLANIEPATPATAAELVRRIVLLADQRRNSP